MKASTRSASSPTMLHHIREIQLRLLAVIAALIAGMALGYAFYEQLFQFIKSPLSVPLHYLSPAGSFNFIIKICLMVGVVVALPVAVYNVIMFIQPALAERLSRTRVCMTTLCSVLLAATGAGFAFFVILPMALRFFFQFQVDGLEALLSADDYLRFVVNGVITFAVIFQLPLIISLADHIKPLPPKKLLKAEKFILVGSIAVGVLVPFALDPTIQLLIASPIMILYNLSLVIVLIQHKMRKSHRQKEPTQEVYDTQQSRALQAVPTPTVSLATPTPNAQKSSQVQPVVATKPTPVRQPYPRQVVRTTTANASVSLPRQRSAMGQSRTRLITDIRPTVRRPSVRKPVVGAHYSADEAA